MINSKLIAEPRRNGSSASTELPRLEKEMA
jgi:hypothetical protein